jgi:hypothetical protein
MACVRCVGHGTWRLHARGVLVRNEPPPQREQLDGVAVAVERGSAEKNQYARTRKHEGNGEQQADAHTSTRGLSLAKGRCGGVVRTGPDVRFCHAASGGVPLLSVFSGGTRCTSEARTCNGSVSGTFMASCTGSRYAPSVDGSRTKSNLRHIRLVSPSTLPSAKNKPQGQSVLLPYTQNHGLMLWTPPFDFSERTRRFRSPQLHVCLWRHRPIPPTLSCPSSHSHCRKPTRPRCLLASPTWLPEEPRHCEAPLPPPL